MSNALFVILKSLSQTDAVLTPSSSKTNVRVLIFIFRAWTVTITAIQIQPSILEKMGGSQLVFWKYRLLVSAAGRTFVSGYVAEVVMIFNTVPDSIKLGRRVRYHLNRLNGRGVQGFRYAVISLEAKLHPSTVYVEGGPVLMVILSPITSTQGFGKPNYGISY